MKICYCVSFVLVSAFVSCRQNVDVDDVKRVGDVTYDVYKVETREKRSSELNDVHEDDDDEREEDEVAGLLYHALEELKRKKRRSPELATGEELKRKKRAAYADPRRGGSRSSGSRRVPKVRPKPKPKSPKVKKSGKVIASIDNFKRRTVGAAVGAAAVGVGAGVATGVAVNAVNNNHGGPKRRGRGNSSRGHHGNDVKQTYFLLITVSFTLLYYVY